MHLPDLVVIYDRPLWSSSGETGAITVANYSHVIQADGGYWSCKFSFNTSKIIAEEWAFNALGRDITVYESGGIAIWRGFIDSVSVSLGALSISRGPLLDVANAVRVKYQTPSYTIANVTIGGDQAVILASGAGTDADSQAKYGARHKEISAGTASTVEATQIQQLYLAENKEASLGHQISTGDAGDISVEVSCMGYVHMLDYLSSNSSPGTMNLSDKITSILAANPDGIFSTDYSVVESNTTPVAQYWEADQTAFGLIKALVSVGSPSPGYNRFIWGILDDLRIYYKAIPTQHEYEYCVQEPRQHITDLNHVEVPPWELMPGKFALVSDMAIGKISQWDRLRGDPRMMFIESVEYSAPWQVKITGSKVGRVDQALARLNLGGM